MKSECLVRSVQFVTHSMRSTFIIPVKVLKVFVDCVELFLWSHLPLLFFQIYSVVDSVISLNVKKPGNKSINEILIEDGVAEKVEESHRSRVHISIILLSFITV